jgi:hypothetical protein
MRRFTGFLLLVVVLVTGAAIGVLGRSWLDDQGSQGQAAREPTAPVAVATSAPAAIAVPTTAPPPPPTTVPPRPTAAPALTPASRDLVVEVSEGDLQSQISDMLVGHSLGTTPLGDTTIQSVTVALRDRQVRVGGAARTGFLNAPFTALGTVAPDANGRPMVRVNEATVGGVLLPDAARVALSDSLQIQVDGLFADRAMKVRTIDIADGKMRLVGTAGS